MSAAIADPARLNGVVERVIRRDSLSLDAQRARCQDGQLGTPETAVGAGVVDLGPPRLVLDHDLSAIVAAVLDAGERGGVGDALAISGAGIRHAAELPQAGAGLVERRRARGGSQ